MKHLLVISLLFSSYVVLAQNAVTEFSHWQPSVQLNLYQEIEKLEKNSRSPEVSVKQIDDENKKAMKELRDWPWGKTNRKKYITKEDATKLLADMASDPVVGYESWKTYDPELRFGFCFGRATWAWLEAIALGYDKSSIKKLFLIGPMQTGDITWQFHVATAIRARGLIRDQWLVVDSNFDKIVTVEEFFEKYKAQSTDNKLRLVITEPQRLGPSSTTKFGPGHYKNVLNDASYNQYFKNLISSISSRINYRHTKQCRYLF